MFHVCDSKCFKLLWLNCRMGQRRAFFCFSFSLGEQWGLLGGRRTLRQPFEPVGFFDWVNTLEIHALDPDLVWSRQAWIDILV